MLNKDLSQKATISNSLRIKYTVNAQGCTRKHTQGQRHHALTFTSWHKRALQCHIFRKPFLNISLQQPALFTSTHPYTSPPFLPSPSPLYASSHSSLHFSLMTPLKWLIKDPKHLYMDPFWYLYRDILLRYPASLNPTSYSCLKHSALWDP